MNIVQIINVHKNDFLSKSLILLTVTHFQPPPGRPAPRAVWVIPWLCPFLKAWFCWQLHTFHPLPVALAALSLNLFHGFAFSWKLDFVDSYTLSASRRSPCTLCRPSCCMALPPPEILILLTGTHFQPPAGRPAPSSAVVAWLCHLLKAWFCWQLYFFCLSPVALQPLPAQLLHGFATPWKLVFV